MSKISVSTIDTADALTPLVLSTGNTSTSTAQIKIHATNNDIVLSGTSKFSGNVQGLSVTQNVVAANFLAASAFYKAGVEFSPIMNVTETLLTSGSTYTVADNVVAALVYCIGGGGGGGGADNGDTAATAVAAGGGGGGTAIKVYSKAELGTSCTYSVGGGGTAGTNLGGNGGNGSPSTFTPNGTGAELTGNGGNGGTGLNTSGQTAPLTIARGTGGSATGGDINVHGADGGLGIVLSASIIYGGDGGMSIFPPDGTGAVLSAGGVADGAAGTNYGVGGGGAAAINTTAGAAGGVGASGAIWIVEFRK